MPFFLHFALELGDLKRDFFFNLKIKNNTWEKYFKYSLETFVIEKEKTKEK